MNYTSPKADLDPLPPFSSNDYDHTVIAGSAGSESRLRCFIEDGPAQSKRAIAIY